jgi:adenine-specific DNA-methyltransferase
VACFIATLPRLPDRGRLRVLDPGAGVGSLANALIARVISERPEVALDIWAFEVDEGLHPLLRDTLADCEAVGREHGADVSARLLGKDFISWGAEQATRGMQKAAGERFDIIIMNPPYRKINRDSVERRALERVGVEVSNLYAAFLVLAASLLDSGGQMAAITPRSFANGAYFRAFRHFFLDRVEFDRIHVYDSRSVAFSDDAVLQENVIFSATKANGSRKRQVIVSSSDRPSGRETVREVPREQVVNIKDPERFIHIPANQEADEVAAAIAALPCQLADLGLQVSTGRVVDFRARASLRTNIAAGTVPLIYPSHCQNGSVFWPIPNFKKWNAIVADESTIKLLLPTETYVLTRRFTAKEERRRVCSVVFEPSDAPSQLVGFENHLNVFHRDGRGISGELAHGLCLWLNSTVVDEFVRQFNGHTQINATDLRRLRYPPLAELEALGSALGTGWPDQEKLDELVATHITVMRGRHG